MNQTPPLWNIYPDVHNNYRTKYENLDRQLKILITIFVHQLSHEDEPQLFPDVFPCIEDRALGFRIGEHRILFRPEIIAQGFRDLRVLHLIDIV